MALRADVTVEDDFFAGEAKALIIEVLDSDDATPKDVTGYTFRWALGFHDYDTPVLEKTSGDGSVTITGVYNVSRLSNTQRVKVALTAADTRVLLPRTAPPYKHALMREDSGSEAVIVFGDFVLQGNAAR